MVLSSGSTKQAFFLYHKTTSLKPLILIHMYILIHTTFFYISERFPHFKIYRSSWANRVLVRPCVSMRFLSTTFPCIRFSFTEMKLLGVEHYGQRPAVEGNLLTIMCTARGSGQMKYRWYKDGSLLNTTLSQRNAWEIRIPRTIRKKQISVLNIDGVEFYDKGESLKFL